MAIAVPMLSRPPVTVMPESAEFGSTLERILSRISLVDAPGFREISRAGGPRDVGRRHRGAVLELNPWSEGESMQTSLGLSK